MVWGYGIFSLYVFLVGLVPNLPSFGGYIRLVAGVLLTVLTAYYVVRQLNGYLAMKQEELEASTQDRAARIQDEKALQAFQSHTCPSCERDFSITSGIPRSAQHGWPMVSSARFKHPPRAVVRIPFQKPPNTPAPPN